VQSRTEPSRSYYDVRQAVVALKGSPAASATGIAGLKPVKLGAQVGTTSYAAIADVIKPTRTPAGYDDSEKALEALKNGQIGGIVVDLPTALYLVSAEFDNGEVLAMIHDLKSEGMTMLIVTHEMGFARQVADRVAFLDQGRVLEQGPPEQVLGDPVEARTRQFLASIIEAGRL
jgi:ABC-type amino acid transport substrate-binding protein